MFGRPEGFGRSELKEIVDSEAPHREELVARVDSVFLFAEEGSNVDDFARAFNEIATLGKLGTVLRIGT